MGVRYGWLLSDRQKHQSEGCSRLLLLLLVCEVQVLSGASCNQVEVYRASVCPSWCAPMSLYDMQWLRVAGVVCEREPVACVEVLCCFAVVCPSRGPRACLQHE
jgi:hypothetical protein